jgi:hypothetical protein
MKRPDLQAADQDSIDSWGKRAGEIVWKDFRETFGAAWLDKFGTYASDTWIGELKHLKSQQVRGALSKIRQYKPPYPGWVPNLPEFLGFARSLEVHQTVQRETTFKGNGVDMTANLILLQYLRRKGACTPQSLKEILRHKNICSEAFRGIITEEQVTKGEFQDALEKRWEEMWSPWEGSSPTKATSSC